MLKLRPKTINEIQSILDESYFTKDSFSIENDPVRNSFLIIKFLPIEDYSFSVKFKDEKYISSEKPGIYLETEEAYSREDFSYVIYAIQTWVERIKEDLDSSAINNKLDLFLNNLRKSFINDQNETTFFTDSEIIELNHKLHLLEILVLDSISSSTPSTSFANSFQSTLNSIKDDLNKYTKNVWFTISGNKIIKEVKGAINYTKNPQERNQLQNKLEQWLH